MPITYVTTQKVDANMADVPSPLTKSSSEGESRSVDKLLGIVRSRGANGVAQVETSPSRSRPLGGFLKRFADLAVATLAILLMAPISLMIVLLILVTMGRPVFYVHERIGFRGRPFGCLKFRSMARNPEDTLRSHFKTHPKAEREWVETQKLRDDPRVTFVGKMIRRTSLDELPQLINVVRGEMSCVGPRPVVADELDRYGAVKPLYMSARPGITGLWQVSGRTSLDYDRRIDLDKEYVLNWSLGLDLKILIKTIPAIARLHDAA